MHQTSDADNSFTPAIISASSVSALGDGAIASQAD